MSEEKSYREIFKATSLFGGVQLIIIISSIIKSKFAALWLGADGIGIIGIFTASITFIFSITSFGIGSSAVRTISQENSKNSLGRLKGSVFLVRKLSLISGLLGTLIMLSFSNILSKVSFGTDFEKYTLSFMLLSVCVFFTTWESGEAAILQGLRRLKYLATSNVISSSCAILFVLPIYYYFGLKGIVPSLIVTCFLSAITAYFYSKRIVLQGHVLISRQKYQFTRDILKLGFTMSISSMMVYGVMLIIRIFIGDFGSLKDVGYYQAAFAILNGYVGLIFTAMAKDYYPRLCEVSDDSLSANKIANQQVEIGMLILGPIIAVLIVTAPLVIKILYSNDFLSIKPIMYWSLIGVFFKMISWSFSYVILSKGDKKSFMIYEIAGNITTLVTHIVGYSVWGLSGLGYAFLFSNFIYFIMVYMIIRGKYGIFLSKDGWIIFINSVACSLLLIFVIQLKNSFLIYAISIPIVCFLIYQSLTKLNEKINLGLFKIFSKKQ